MEPKKLRTPHTLNLAKSIALKSRKCLASSLNSKNPLQTRPPCRLADGLRERIPEPQKLWNYPNPEQDSAATRSQKTKPYQILAKQLPNPLKCVHPNPFKHQLKGSNMKRPPKNIEGSTLHKPNYTNQTAMMKRSSGAKWRRDATSNHSNPRSLRNKTLMTITTRSNHTV